MKVVKIFFDILIAGLFLLPGLKCSAQCNIDTPNTQVGFTPHASTPVVNGTATFQTTQIYVMPSFTRQGNTAIVDSLVFTAVNGLPAGVTYSFNPASATVRGGGNGALCFSGTPTSGGGAYPLSLTGVVYTNFGPVLFANVPAFATNFSYTFYVSGPPAASFSAAAYCAGDSIPFNDLTVANPADTAWQWTFTGASPGTSQLRNPKVVFPAAGAYNVKLVVANTYGADSVTKTITIYPPPTATVTTTPAGGPGIATGSATITVTSGIPPYDVFWSQGSDSTTIGGVLPGIYTVTLYDSAGCKYLNDSVVVGISTGIIQFGNSQQVKIYPNPTTGMLNLAWGQPSDAEISIADLKGNVVARYTSAGKSLDVFDIHLLTTGTYILRITDKGHNQERSTPLIKF